MHPQGYAAPTPGPRGPSLASSGLDNTKERLARRQLRVALMNDYEVVVVGLQAMLEPYAERVCVVEPDSQVPVVPGSDLGAGPRIRAGRMRTTPDD